MFVPIFLFKDAVFASLFAMFLSSFKLLEDSCDISACLVGSEMCIRDRVSIRVELRFHSLVQTFHEFIGALQLHSC